MALSTADLPKLSTLQALKRPDGEEDQVWPQKRQRLEKRKDAFVTITAINNFAKFISLTTPSLDNIERMHSTSDRSLTSTFETCETVKAQIVTESEKLVSGINQVKATQDFIERGRKKLEDIPVSIRFTQKDLKAEEISLTHRLEEFERQAQALEELVSKSGVELERVKSDLTKLTEEERRRKDERTNMMESEGPQRERLGLMASFVKVKTRIHEKLSGYEIVSIEDGNHVKIALKEDEVFIDLEFDTEHKLVGASASMFADTKIEAALREQAIKDNRPSTFIRGIKLLVHNANSLDKELEELRLKAKFSRKPFEVEYNASKRILLALFNRGSIYAKFRIPLDYTISMIELIHLERPESSRSLKPVAQELQSRLVSSGRGKLVSDWVLELNEVL